MITVNELRRGNFIQHGGGLPEGPFIVDEIRKQSISVTQLSTNLPFGFLQEDIEGIPLILDLLKKSGFKPKQNYITGTRGVPGFLATWWESGESDSFNVLINEPKGVFYVNHGRLSMELLHLHQLQNLYFALLRKELEVKF